MSGTWVSRRASVDRVCDSCDDLLPAGQVYYLMLTGERFCADCPPDEEECSL